MQKLNKLRLLFMLFALFAFVGANAQSTVSGVVTDATNGEPIPGVTVMEVGTSNGTMTDVDGSFSLSVNAETTLKFSFIGYDSQEATVTPGNQVTIQLHTSSTDIEEVVVIGYGQVKKGDATGAVTTVGADDFNKGALTSAQDLIVGKASGVVITSSGGAPGSGSQIRIRGGSSLRASNDPLIVIDGVPVSNEGISGSSNPLAFINPNDIETFTVLKDASATAIYGARASNGVILITTKKGKKGAIKASYNGNLSIGKAAKFLEVYDGDAFRALIQDRVDNHGLTDFALTRLGTENTDWQAEIYQTAISHDHNVSASGSVAEVPFRLSFGYTDQDGLLKESNMQRTTFNLSANPSLLDNTLKIDLNAKGMYTNYNFSNTDAIGAALQFDPTQPIMNGNTKYGGYTTWTDLSTGGNLNDAPNNIATKNPVAAINLRDNTSKVQRYLMGAKFDYAVPVVEGLNATLNMSYDYSTSKGNDNTDPLAGWSYREPGQNAKQYTQTVTNSLLDFFLNYSKELGSTSKLNLTGGYSWEHYYNEGENSRHSWEMIDNEYTDTDTTQYKNEYYTVSFFGRANYSLMDKYLLTATVRYDGSSRFASENRWGLFPAFAFAWKLNNEGFLADVDAISNLKLRLGWGVTGQQNIPGGFYPYIPTYTDSQQGTYYQFGNTFYSTLRPDAYDKNLQWEETTTQNVALDFGFMDDKITGSVDLYKRTTDNLINEVPIAAGTNFSNFLVTNVGSLENKGFEANLTVRPISTSDMSLEISTNFTYNVNEITKLTMVDDPTYVGYDAGGIAGGVGNNVQINSIGQSANTFFLFQQVYGADGMPIQGLYVDRSGKGGTVSGNNLNKYYVHNPAPQYLIGLSSRLNYKQFDFSFSGRFNIGNYVYNNNASNIALYQNVYNQSGYASNILTAVENTEFETAQYWSDLYLENASFFRMDNISFGYSFDQLFTEKLNGRVSLGVDNAFVITNYTGLDPEVAGGIDNNIYPRPRTFIFGVSLNF